MTLPKRIGSSTVPPDASTRSRILRRNTAPRFPRPRFGIASPSASGVDPALSGLARTRISSASRDSVSRHSTAAHSDRRIHPASCRAAAIVPASTGALTPRYTGTRRIPGHSAAVIGTIAAISSAAAERVMGRSVGTAPDSRPHPGVIWRLPGKLRRFSHLRWYMIDRMRRFGPFELDPATGELRKNGLRVRLQDQPLRILQALLDTPGELVTREELRDRLWPSDTFVDFERSLNAAVAKLRQSLGDSAEQPVYIETVARKGYRFVAPVTAEVGDAPAPTPRRPKFPTAVGIAAAAFTIAAVGWIALRPTPALEPGPAAFTVTLPDGLQLPAGVFMPQMALSPDGRTLAFVAFQDGVGSLWLRPIGSEASRRLDGTQAASAPFWSPDSREIGFFAEGKLKKVAAAGGLSWTLSDVQEAFGGTWGRKGFIVFADGTSLYSVPSDGGVRTRVLPLDESHGEIRQTWPSFLPDGRRFIYFSAHTDPSQHTVSLSSLDGARPRVLFKNDTRAVFAAPDHLLYVREGVLFAQRWDFDSPRSLGDSRRVVADVNAFSVGQSAFSVSDSGALAWRTGAAAGVGITVYTRDGRRLRTVGPPGPYTQFTLSPDEKTIAITMSRPFELPSRLWLLRIDSQIVSHYDFGKTANSDPVWSPDSRRIAFVAFDGDWQSPTELMLWTIGEPAPRRLFADGKVNKPDDWSPDGRFVLCRRNDALAFAVPVQEGAPPPEVGDTASPKDQMHLSPDGRMVAYNTIGPRPEVFVARFPAMTGRVQVSSAGGSQPIWTRKGRELIYAARDHQLMSVQIQDGATIETSTPRPLFRPTTIFAPWASQYAVSADGDRFYVLESSGSPADALHIVTQWQQIRP
jgi:DNA-binding winged helix-turn-helix (wHTH) protein